MQCSNAVHKPWGGSGSGKNKLAIKNTFGEVKFKKLNKEWISDKLRNYW